MQIQTISRKRCNLMLLGVVASYVNVLLCNKLDSKAIGNVLTIQFFVLYALNEVANSMEVFR